ncbi:unnamed protein product, partial [Amoebophrya sp. A120]
ATLKTTASSGSTASNKKVEVDHAATTVGETEKKKVQGAKAVKAASIPPSMVKSLNKSPSMATTVQGEQQAFDPT